MRTVRNTALLALPLIAFSGLMQNIASAQAPAAAPSVYTTIQGTITKVDLAGKVISIKTDAADTTVKFSALTKVMELPPGEADTKKATPMKPEDISVGDHILARAQTKDLTGLPAGFLYINRASDIAKDNAAKAAEWQTAVSGFAESVDPAAKKITMKVKGAAAAPDRDVVLDLSGAVSYQRFSDKSFDYEKTDVNAIKTGDHLRVLGSKNADVTQIKVTDLAADAIKQIGATIKSIDPATGQISAIDMAKKPVTITVRPGTKVKRLDDPTAQTIARIVNPSFQGAGRGRGAGGGAGAGGGDGAGAGRGFGGGQAGGGAPGGSGFGGRGGRARGGAGQIQTLIDQQPDTTVADLKPGEPIIVSGPSSPDSSTFSAMMVLAGVDPILRAAPSTGADPLGSGWSNAGAGGGE
jgi:Cu/Ag efflux protein CusF